MAALAAASLVQEILFDSGLYCKKSSQTLLFFPLPSPGTWACPEGHRAKHPQSFDKGKERQEETAETHGNTIRNCLRGVSSRAAMPGLWRYHQICAFAVRILVPSDRKYLGCSPVLRGAVFQCFSCLRPACTLTQSTLIRLCQAK